MSQPNAVALGQSVELGFVKILELGIPNDDLFGRNPGLEQAPHNGVRYLAACAADLPRPGVDLDTDGVLRADNAQPACCGVLAAGGLQ